jgi:hypothetical protein
LFVTDELLQAPLITENVGLGRCFDRLIALDGLTKNPTGITVPSDFGARVAAALPLGRLLPGSYELDLEFQVTGALSDEPALVMGVVSNGRLISDHVADARVSGAERLIAPLEVSGDGWQNVSILIKALGNTDFTILDLALR